MKLKVHGQSEFSSKIEALQEKVVKVLLMDNAHFKCGPVSGVWINGRRIK